VAVSQLVEVTASFGGQTCASLLAIDLCPEIKVERPLRGRSTFNFRTGFLQRKIKDFRRIGERIDEENLQLPIAPWSHDKLDSE